jgi:hypothetical protein
MSRRTARGRPSRNPGALRLALILAALGVVAACQATPGPESATTSIGAPAAQADVDAIRATIDAVNAAAGGPVADQQAQLAAHVDPARRDEAQRCPAATTTVRLAPVEQGLRELVGPTARPAGSATPASAAATAADAGGTVYGLPTLIRVFSGERLIGTDLTTLRLVVRDTGAGPEAFLTPFCVN